MKKTLLFVWAIAYLSVTYAADLAPTIQDAQYQISKAVITNSCESGFDLLQEVDHSLNKRLVALCRIFALIQTHYYQIKKGR